MSVRSYLFTIFAAVLCGCVTERSISDPCVDFNLGTRITADREWPAAVDKAERLITKIWTESISIYVDGPAKYESLRNEYDALMMPAIAYAGACYNGSLFNSIVARMDERVAKLDRSVSLDIPAWEERVAKREARLMALTAASDALKRFSLGVVDVEILEIQASWRTRLVLRVTNQSEGRIVHPVTGRLYGFDADSPGIGGVLATGFTLYDDYNNMFRLKDAKPKITAVSDRGIYPGNSMQFELIFGSRPVDASKFVRLVIDQGALGNTSAFTIELPRELFLP